MKTHTLKFAAIALVLTAVMGVSHAAQAGVYGNIGATASAMAQENITPAKFHKWKPAPKKPAPRKLQPGDCFTDKKTGFLVCT